MIKLKNRMQEEIATITPEFEEEMLFWVMKLVKKNLMIAEQN